MKENVIQEKSYRFALRVIKLYKYLIEEKKEFVLSKQILKSGTSIGANIEEAIGGQSKRDFYAKLTLAYKEARETHYWLRLLRDSQFLESALAESLLDDCAEILKIIGSIQKTMRQKNKNQ
ncbi:MAG TPA: four helix bundle protein [Caldithrix abyssi]|uniref:Four helix bundle protein n=1 Tax=Caldithrix abyssi TaxID=187145 RepID=A0A7V4WUA8_CALAY|nr:four helix bundle protein [Caldithrix abyssi]